ncbi:MAG: TnsA endonuclease N-terminal domain-containing protein [Holophaga sp.]|nr:TnsA endonuclease N-terminal domain-containing protein [Holophaga sp.]
MALTTPSQTSLIPNVPSTLGNAIPRVGVRKIPKNALSVTGRLACAKSLLPQAFESTLERDAMILLDSDPTVEAFVTQPVRIAFQDAQGKAHSYTPDILVTFKPDPRTGTMRPPLLIEVKPRSVLSRNWEELRPKFKAAVHHACLHGWKFMILTEQEIRVPQFLKNLRFLLGFLKRQPDPQWAVAILDALRKRKECTVLHLLEGVCQSQDDHAIALPTLWHLVATRTIWTDLRIPLGQESKVSHALLPDPRFLWGEDGPPLRTRRFAPAESVPTCDTQPQPLLSLLPGSRVTVGNRPCVILRVIDLCEVLIRDDATGLPERARIASLKPYDPIRPKPRMVPDLVTVPEAAWDTALKRDAVIRPLLVGRRTKERVLAAAVEAEVSKGTIYRWLNLFRDSGELASALIPHPPSGGRGKSRLPEAVEEIIQKTLEDYYLRSQKRTPAATALEVIRRCEAIGIEAPHSNTVRKRILWISEETKLRRRMGAKAAAHAFRTVKGPFPTANWPLETVQIDHTPLDIILVDDHARKPIGRPWITLVMDVYSRMVLGYHISLDPPGDVSTGLCLVHAILPKDGWLAMHNIQTEWPCWGIPGTVHADNAKEFRGNLLQREGREYGFNLEWRPLGKPEYGAHIERLLGTLLKEIHTLPGTTFSSITQRGTYKSTQRAILSFKEFEEWLATHITGNYHNRPHGNLDGDTPLERYRRGILGSKDTPGRGLPDRIGNEAKLRMDFLPFFERTVQPSGVEIDGISYFHASLRTLLNERDPDTPKLKRKFVIRRDPRDVSTVYLMDPKTQSYLDIPYRDISHPPISIWEWRATQSAAKESESKEANETLRFKAIESMRAVERVAAKRTASARRNEARRDRHEELDLHGRKARKDPKPPPTSAPPAPGTKAAKPVVPLRTAPVMAFDEIE